ncbi:MAG: VWA domain-containing protein [Hyphomicrobiales bacterium]
MTKSNVPTSSAQGASTPARSGAKEVSDFLAQVNAMKPVAAKEGERGRLIFAMDATMSRQPTWDRALQIQSEMFAETAKIGGLDVQLVFFRGFGECRSSKWVSHPEALAKLMTQVSVRGGNTQISKVLSHVLTEARAARVNACVYVGDCMEENADALCAKAGEIGLLGVPVFLFQEGHDIAAERTFKEIARLTRGAWCRFDQSSARQLKELLAAVAVYAAGGRQALVEHARDKGGGSTLLLEQLK